MPLTTGRRPDGSSPVVQVWAPPAGTVEICWRPAQLDAPTGGFDWGTCDDSVGGGVATGFTQEPMEPAGQGWWRWPRAASGQDRRARAASLDYGFVLDGVGPPLPDPRSAHQPFGVHGPSRTFDVSAFHWRDQAWRGARGGQGLLGTAIYELHVGTFTPQGTLDAALGRLDHLVALGVEVVELMPVMAFDGDRGWGYDQVGLCSVHEVYGGPAALQRFVDAAHRKGLAVCLDVVHNHLGPSGNYLARFGPYFTDTHHTPWGEAVNLDTATAAPVRAFLIESALRWLDDFHVDALRLDAVHELKDDSSQHILAELGDAVADLSGRLGRPLELIAESDLNDVAMVSPTGEGGLGMSAQWDDDIHHALHVVLTGETDGYYRDFAGGPAETTDDLAVLGRVLTQGFLHAGQWSSFRERHWGRPIPDRKGFDARRLLAYLQTHDQVGNRALGDRIHHLISPTRQALGAALYLLGPFTPMIFMGEEWAATTPWQFFTSFDDELGELVREGRRAEFRGHGWHGQDIPDPQSPQTFQRSRLDWSEVDAAGHREMLDWYTACVRLRRSRLQGPAHLSDVAVTHDGEARSLVMRHGGLLVAGVLGEQTTEVALPPSEVLLRWDPSHTAQIRSDVGADPGGSPPHGGGGIRAGYRRLAPEEVLVLRVSPA